MVCPNCHSEHIIQVQDQHFCINCGQMVPEEPVPVTPGAAKSRAKLQSNGLPEGVKILPIGKSAPPETPSLATAEPPRPAPADTPVAPSPEPAATPEAGPAEVTPIFFHSRARLAPSPEPSGTDVQPAKRRKPGRPKAGRLDMPRAIASTAPASLPAAPPVAPAAPAGTPAPAAANTPVVPPGPRSMSDLAPRRAHHARGSAHKGQKAAENTASQEKPVKSEKSGRQKRARAHRVGVPPLHYAPLLVFSFRARVRPSLLALAALGAASLGVAAAFGVWGLLTKGVGGFAAGVMQGGVKIAAETAILAALYYIGRSLGQTAITYGIGREADQRPVRLSRQFGTAINTFGRRLKLDLAYGAAEISLIAAGVTLFITGGQPWPVNSNLQLGLIFSAYLILLYALTALALSRGLAGVNLALTTHKAGTAAKLGWQLFSHRIELIGPRFGAVLMETFLALPLIAVGVVMVLSAPAEYQIVVAIGAGFLAWLAGALLGVGTAAWWAMLYRQLVMADRPGSAASLMSGRQPEDPRRAPLALIVALTTLLIAAALALPWLPLG